MVVNIRSLLAQPWSIVGGNVLSALIGVSVGMLVPDVALACGLAAGLAIAAMYFLRCLHPPGGAVALTAIPGGADVAHEVEGGSPPTRGRWERLSGVVRLLFQRSGGPAAEYHQ